MKDNGTFGPYFLEKLYICAPNVHYLRRGGQFPMNRYNNQKVSRRSSHKKGALVGSALALLLIAAAVGAFWIYKSDFKPAQKPQVVRYIADTAPRSNESPFALQRAISTAAVTSPATMMPWDIAFD